jgi:UDP-N-acetylglucosamine acyltransferase
MPQIHALSVVHPDAVIEDDVSIGPFCTIGPQVRIGASSRLISHVVVDGDTSIGTGNTFYPYASIGMAPQDKKYAGEATRLVIGNDNVFRESCTIHRGTALDKGVTTIGSRVLAMAYAHVAHDCIVGDDVILANGATLAGHVRMDEFAILGGLSAVHQFCRVGAHVMIGGCACITQDIAPYVLGHGNPFAVSSVNLEGLKRRGFSAEAVAAVRAAYKTVWRSGLTLKEAVASLDEIIAKGNDDERAALTPLVEFLRAPGRGLAR